jgi:hypothetical protein
MRSWCGGSDADDLLVLPHVLHLSLGRVLLKSSPLVWHACHVKGAGQKRIGMQCKPECAEGLRTGMARLSGEGAG